MTNQKNDRIGKTNTNYQGCSMKIVEYNMNRDMVVEFQDDYKARVHTSYKHFDKGTVKNPYYPSAYEVGMIGNKYPICIDGTPTKEYEAWRDMLKRCFDEKFKERYPTYKEATCCDEWLLFENFYEWLHSQPNFDKWYNGERWAIDKDILFKGNKVYSPDACCLVSQNVNNLFVKNDATRGDLPIGVAKYFNKFKAYCINPFTGLQSYLGLYLTSSNAFQAYKKEKENFIKQVAKIEYDNGNITEQCYDAMMCYEVEITD